MKRHKRSKKKQLFKLIIKRKKVNLINPAGKPIMILTTKFYKQHASLIDAIVYNLNRKLDKKYKSDSEEE